jgi:hypothetical protein
MTRKEKWQQFMHENALFLAVGMYAIILIIAALLGPYLPFTPKE